MVKHLMGARMRFIYKHMEQRTKKDDAFAKKLAGLDAYVFHQSAALIDVYGSCKNLADASSAK